MSEGGAARLMERIFARWLLLYYADYRKRDQIQQCTVVR